MLVSLTMRALGLALLLAVVHGAAAQQLTLTTTAVTVAASGNSWKISGNVVLKNTQNNPAPGAYNNITTLYFIKGTTFAPIYATTQCPLGMPNPVSVRYGQPITCKFSFTTAKVINGVKTVPGTIYAKAWLANGKTLTSPTVNVVAPTAPAIPTLTITGLKTSVNAGTGKGTVTGTVQIVNKGSTTAYIKSTNTLYFLSGTTFAPITTPVTCLLGAPNPLPLAAGATLKCPFTVSPSSTGPASIYAKVVLSNGASATSPSYAVKF